MHAPKWLSTCQISMGQAKETEGHTLFSFMAVAWKSHTSFLLTCHWPVLSHVTTPSYRAVWEM